MVKIRELEADDVDAASLICSTAFDAFNASVSLPPEFEEGVPKALLEEALSQSRKKGFVAVGDDGKVIGSNISDCRDQVCAVGPISVDGSVQNVGAGRLLMQAVMDHGKERGLERGRLVQISANVKSFSLYLNLGYDPVHNSGYYVGWPSTSYQGSLVARTACLEDVDECDALFGRLEHGLSRRNEISDSIQSTTVVECDGKIVAYCTAATIVGHGVSESIEAFQCIVAFLSAPNKKKAATDTLAFHVPHNRPQLSRWLAQSGFRLQRQVTHMVYGPYNSPPEDLLYCPSITY